MSEAFDFRSFCSVLFEFATVEADAEHQRPESDHGVGASVHRRGAINSLVCPDTKATATTIDDQQEPERYLTRVRACILAEYACFLREVRPETLRARMIGDNEITSLSGPIDHDVAAELGNNGDKLQEYHHHLMVIGGRLSVVRYHSASRRLSFTTEGDAWPVSPRQRRSEFSVRRVRSTELGSDVLNLGFVGDFISELSACESLLEASSEGDEPRLLRVVANPTLRGAVSAGGPPRATATSPATCVAAASHPLALGANAADDSAHDVVGDVDVLLASDLQDDGVVAATAPINDALAVATAGAPLAADAVPINDLQADAVAGLSRELEGVQGPPGTGKSTTIYHILRTKLGPGEVALATCVQNKAVDAIADKLADRMRFFVLGNPQRLGLVAKYWTIKAQVDRDVEVVAVTKMEQQARRWFKQCDDAISAKEQSPPLGRGKWATGSDRSRGASFLPGARPESPNPWALLWQTYLRHRYPNMYTMRAFLKRACGVLSETVAYLRRRAHEEIMYGARAILCTVAGTAGLHRMELLEVTRRVTVAILDEAGTTPEAKLPVLLLLPQLRQIIAIGDQKQLAPFSRIAEPRICHAFQERGYCRRGSQCRFEHVRTAPVIRGFFQRLVDALPEGAVPMLLQQYRMHPAICSLVAELFYGGVLQTPAAVAQRRLQADAHGLWCSPIRGQETNPHPRSTSLVNRSEVAEVLRVYRGMQRDGKEVLIITFYKAQYTALCEAFERAGEQQGPKLRICTVDQSQGSEADVVILSTVRANREGKIGFLDNPNRLNVAISRAKEKLVVVGNPDTLTGNPLLARVWARCRQLGDG